MADRSKIPTEDFVFPEDAPDGGFPITDAGSVMDAVHSWGRYRGSRTFAEFKTRLTAIAKRKGYEASLPDSWTEDSEPAGEDAATGETTKSARAVKFTGKDTIEGLAMPYGIDTDGETFTPRTDFCFPWFGKSGRPSLFEHGLDDEMQSSVVGRQTDYEDREEGIWATVQLERNARYRKAVDELIAKGALGFSAGAMAHLATKNARGEITRFPWVELSLTPIPANPRALGVHYVKSSDFMARLEIEPPQPVKAALAAMDEWASRTETDALPDGAKFADLVDRLSVDGPAWIKARRDWNLKSGRVLSAATRERLTAHPAALRQLADDLDELLASADAPKESKSADLWAEVIQTERTLARLLGVPFAGEPIQ